MSVFFRLPMVALMFSLFTGHADAKTRVDIELLLAVDASGSVDAREFELQLGGIARAFRDREVIQAIGSGPQGRIAVALMLWSDAMSRKAVSPWRIINGPESALAFSDLVIAQVVRRKSFLGKAGTGIGSAIGEGIRQLETNAFDGMRRVIDVSGDGHETPLRFGEGMALPEAHRRASRRNITVNGLAILSDDPNLASYYERKVILGPGSFVITADDYGDFGRAIKIKLLREIAAPTVQLDGGGEVEMAGHLLREKPR